MIIVIIFLYYPKFICLFCVKREFYTFKCIVLEALRQESGDKSIVTNILSKIYERDKKHSYI